MEFSCPRDEFWFGVRLCSRALGSKSSLPILAGIKLQAQSDQLLLQSTDLERAISCTIPIENRGGEGAVVVSGDLLSKITGRLPSAPVEVRTTDERLELSCGPTRIELLTMALEDYPEIPSLPEQSLCKLPKEQLLRGLEQTTFAALSARETTRLSLTGVDMVFKPGSLRLVATNGYRLALKELTLPELDHEGEYLVSSDALKDLQTILNQAEGEEVELYQDGQNIFFKVDNIVFMAKLLAEDYPDFERVIPRENPIGLILDREEFLEALQRAEITAAEESGAVILESDGTQLAVRSQSAEKGEVEENLALKRPSEPIRISFKAEYLIEALKKMASPEIAFWLADPESAGLLEPASEAEEDQGFIYVCMPIRLE